MSAIGPIDINDWDKCEITLVKENEDGSADYTLNLGPKTANYLMSYAFVAVLKQVIAEGKTLTPPDGERKAGD